MRKTRQPCIRPLQPFEAADAIDAVFSGMSEESKRLRFHVPMPRLPAFARAQLADVDETSRVALGAWVGEHPVGIARLAATDDGEAEIAVTVVDAWHGRGVGRLLLERLVSRARELGYRTLEADVLEENAAMLHLLCEVFPDARVTRSGGVVHVTCPVPALPRPAPIRLPAQRPPRPFVARRLAVW